MLIRKNGGVQHLFCSSSYFRAVYFLFVFKRKMQWGSFPKRIWLYSVVFIRDAHGKLYIIFSSWGAGPCVGSEFFWSLLVLEPLKNLRRIKEEAEWFACQLFILLNSGKFYFRALIVGLYFPFELLSSVLLEFVINAICALFFQKTHINFSD